MDRKNAFCTKKNIILALKKIHSVLAFQKVFFPVQSFCRNDIFPTFPRTPGSRSGGTFYIPEWPRIFHTTIRESYDIPREKPHYIYQYITCLGESWVNHDFALLFFLRVSVIFTKIPGFMVISDIFPRAIILHSLRTFGRQGSISLTGRLYRIYGAYSIYSLYIKF